MTGPNPSAGPTTATQLLHFRDLRAPQEIQWQLERDLMELFTPVEGAPQYTLQATMQYGTMRFFFELRFEAALPSTNAYSLVATLTDPTSPAEPPVELQKRLTSWMSHWARGWVAAEPVAPGNAADGRYQAMVQAAKTAEAHLASVRDLQQEILRRMRAGDYFRTAHKEGGTTISHHNGRWSRADYGDWSTARDYRDEAEFLAFLRTFFDTEVSRNVAPDGVPEETAWRLILRLLQAVDFRDPPIPAPSRAERYGIVAWGLVVTTAFALLGAKLRIIVRGRAPVPGLDALVVPSFAALGLCAIIAGVWMRRNWK